MPLLTLDGLTAGYGDAPVIRHVSLSVDAGEIVCLLGANGTGKTTTLRTIAGGVRPASGSITWDGRPIARTTTKRVRAGLGYITEERSIFTTLTAEENLRVGLGSVDDALEVLPELAPHLKRRAGLLSGGQQQILGLARALAARPRLLLADELSLGLAPMVVQRLLSTLRAAASDHGVGVLLVEQHVHKALAFADRGYVMRRGEIVLEGTASELTNNMTDIEATYVS